MKHKPCTEAPVVDNAPVGRPIEDISEAFSERRVSIHDKESVVSEETIELIGEVARDL